MAAPRTPLSRFALIAAAGTLAAMLMAWQAGSEALLRPALALWVGLAAWLAGFRGWLSALAAVPVTVALYLSLVVMPVFLLLGGRLDPVTGRAIAGLAGHMAALSVLPILAGWGLSRIRPSKGTPA